MASLSSSTPLIRLLESANNKKGDLFTRLKGDLFYALGYENLQFDVARSGREIDIIGLHRTEERRVVVECKAHVAKMGGGELNKFRGAASCERDLYEPTPVTAYFVSLGGFTETSKAQEQEKKPHKRLILLDSEKIISELIKAKILISKATATEKAGRCAQYSALQGAVLDGAILLAHQVGYIWAIFYAQGKQRSHYALIHADGTPLASSIAQQVISADKSCNGDLHQYTYLTPEPPQPDKETQEQAALAQYQQWVSTECGEIQLDGIPADAELSAYTLKLERLFVPLKVEEKSKDENNEEQITTYTVGSFLSQHDKFSLLAKPGGGKSTLLKRLAVAYAEPSRLKDADDQLPNRVYLPLLLRCRELRERAHKPIRELLKDLSQNACMDEQQTAAFIRLIDKKLKAGEVLLLIDGLDEISDESTRTSFAGNLRSFLAMFPQVAMIATSREAGYRHVAGVIASSCKQVTMASFDESDVTQLCQSWHVEVVGDKQSVRDDAIKLAATIWGNTRVRALAENPLMLTTLLVIRRCIGELPTKRVELYRQSVEVLIRTWNTEGYEAMNLEEALTQLSFVACAMMKAGIQQIGYKQLVKLLQQARKELEVELAYTKLSPQEFIERIEYRSSLLMQTGHERIDGELQAVYEFRHLTFQEYLTARGFIEQQYPGWEEDKTLLELLEPHLEEEQWKEVIPLTAVMAKRKAEPLIAKLIDTLQRSGSREDNKSKLTNIRLIYSLLLQCLLDEVQISLTQLKAAIQQVTRLNDPMIGSFKQLGQGKFSSIIQEVIESSFFDHTIKWDEFYSAFSELVNDQLVYNEINTEELYQKIIAGLTSTSDIDQCRSALVCMQVMFHRNDLGNNKIFSEKEFEQLQRLLSNLAGSESLQVCLCISWSLAWFGINRIFTYAPNTQLLMNLIRLSNNKEVSVLSRLASWSLASQPILDRDLLTKVEKEYCIQQFETMSKQHNYYSVLKVILVWYKCLELSNTELLKMIDGLNKYFSNHTAIEEIKAHL